MDGRTCRCDCGAGLEIETGCESVTPTHYQVDLQCAECLHCFTAFLTEPELLTCRERLAKVQKKAEACRKQRKEQLAQQESDRFAAFRHNPAAVDVFG